MLDVKTTVKVIYPKYAKGIKGIVIAREESTRRWLVKLNYQERERSETLILSLKELDFEVIESDDI
ncbi:hypothetical protein [Myxosarcina sp. GI1]|uniref:hypothetical protein n=1 Tax=Myxosarcina sp. GI1 TaxID=1541065 RepID=UPI000567E590|nr:hypothetical protein [Myxosarcina sp. GI1]